MLTSEYHESWRDGLVYRYNELHRVVEENIPEIWQGLEFLLSSHRILNIHGCTLPFIGIILARPSTCKTVTLSLLEQWYCTYYTDTFSPKSWITHSTAKESEEELSKIDMLPQIKDRHFLTPELAPIFTTDEKDLGQIWGTITRIADGHGLQTNSGAWGHRGYGDTMFVWTGAAVDVPYKVYKLLGNLGFKIYFFRLPYNEKGDNDLLKNLKEDFNLKKSNIASALYEYLEWFEIGPQLIQEGFLSKMKWDFQKDDDQALLWIIKITKLLSHLRCIAQTWTIGEDSQGCNYGYTTSQPESPERAAQVLCNLARGHALTCAGRNFVTLEDIPIVVKTALSTAIIDRVGLLHTLTANEGTLNTKQVANALKVVNKTALRVMTELCIIGLVDMWDDTTTTDRYTKRITLKKEFQWLLSEDFQKLCEGFNPVNYKPVKEPKAGAETGTKQDPFSKERISTFWKTFDKLVEDQIRSNPGMEIDKGTISREDLQDELVSTGNFTQSDAAMMINHIEQKDGIEQIDGWDTIRRKVKP